MNIVLSRRGFIGASLTGLALTSVPPLATASYATELLGAWSPPFDLGGVAIHAQLMPNDEILFFSYVEGDPTVDHTSMIRTYHLASGRNQLAEIGYHRDLFCAAMNQLPDGRAYISGGHDHHTGKRSDAVGINLADTYDPWTRTWTPAAPLLQKRWYPTALGMPDGKTLIVGGGEAGGLPSPWMERYDPITDTIEKMPDTASKNLGWYPRMHLLANGKLIRTGTAQRSHYFNYATARWTSGPLSNFGTRKHGNSVLLSGNTKAMIFGGQSGTSTSPPTNVAEILDTAAATPAWKVVAPMKYARIHASAVLLPDDTVLVIGGGTSRNFDGPIRATEVYDPSTNTWTEMASQQVQRMYHSTAVLLPDGRVFSAGSDSGTQRNTGEIFSPPYLFKGTRPAIIDAPDRISHGESFTISTDLDIAKLRLYRPSAVTHQVDTDMRSVPLTFSSSGTTHSVAGVSATEAPPGYYMIFAVNPMGVPSVARWVRVG